MSSLLCAEYICFFLCNFFIPECHVNDIEDDNFEKTGAIYLDHTVIKLNNKKIYL